jgi:hypothetical protein
MVYLVCLVYLVGLDLSLSTDEIDQIDQTDQTDQIDPSPSLD